MFNNQLEVKKKKIKKIDKDAESFFYIAHKKTWIKELASHIYWL